VTHFNAKTHACRYRVAAEPARAFAPAAPAHEEIARLAYAYWEAGGRQDGRAVENWLRAERDLRARCTTRP
jgi:hypothetical protein